ncbi:Csu type fimbrial protein [Erwinia sp. V71]|uniref:Csu type fimbrial protein n=1 Tax=Erwinia sp. V71 TaxID=3369424 RepID=UPI003F625301
MKTLLKLLLLPLLLLSFYSHAACTASSSSFSFTSVGSFTLASTAQYVSAPSSFSCVTDSLLSLLSSYTVTATISSANASGTTPRLYSSAASSYIPYQLCSDSVCSSTYTVGTTNSWTSTSLITALSSGSSTTMPLYLVTTTGANVPAGTYTDTITIVWTYTTCSGIGLAGICLGTTTASSTATLSVTMVVTNDCTINSAPDVDFGSAALPENFSTVNGTLSITCTQNATYSVDLTSVNSSSGDWRQMSASVTSGTAYLQYQLYQSDGTAWTSSNDLSATGTGESQTISYSAAVNADQDNQPAGTYTDTVNVTVTY